MAEFVLYQPQQHHATSQPSAGAAGSSVGTSYAISLPLDELQRYYDDQMEKHCEDDWEFTEIEIKDSESCIEAGCTVASFWSEQYFSVLLCPITEIKTDVWHVDYYD